MGKKNKPRPSEAAESAKNDDTAAAVATTTNTTSKPSFLKGDAPIDPALASLFEKSVRSKTHLNLLHIYLTFYICVWLWLFARISVLIE